MREMKLCVPGVAKVAAELAPGGSPAVWASTATTAHLILHYHSGTHRAAQFKVSSLTGSEAQVNSSRIDGHWETAEFDVSGAVDGYIGITVAGDSVFSFDRRYIRAERGTAEAWVIDGDARIYGQPKALDPASIYRRGLQAYVAVSALTSVLGVEKLLAKNTYAFDGAPIGTIDILTLRSGRDSIDISPATSRAASNVTSNMLAKYSDQVFEDIDGFEQDGTYYLSFNTVERLLQVGTLLDDEGAYVLPRAHAAYDRVTPSASPEDVGFSTRKLSELDSYINTQIDAGASGISLSVVKDGKLVKESAYGSAKKYDTPHVDGAYQPAVLLPRERWEKTQKDTLFDLASNTKMYATNYAVQQLVSQGKMNLDRTLQSYSGWENFTDQNSIYTGKWTVGGPGGIKARLTGKETVTIRDILHHEGGLIPDPEYPNRNSAGDLYYQNEDFADRAGIVDVISKTPLMYSPRTTFAYSDVDYMILGLLVEQISGQTIDKYFTENIARPLGIEHTTYTPLKHGFRKNQIAATELNGNTRDGNVTFGTLPDGKPVPLRHNTLQGEVHDEKAFYTMGQVAGHAGLFSTAGDMAALTQLMLNDGIYNGQQLFTPQVVAEFTKPHTVLSANDDSATVGLGWRVHSKSASGYYCFNWGPSRSSYGHQGWTGTLTIIDPVHNMTVSILSSYRHSPVASPPDGFAGANFPVADMVPITSRIFNALEEAKEQYSILASITPVEPVTVRPETPHQEAVQALPDSTTVVTAAGVKHPVQLAWTLDSYREGGPGSYTAHAIVTLPRTVVQPAVPIELTVNTEVRVVPGNQRG